jgi:hypothetical protein
MSYHQGQQQAKAANEAAEEQYRIEAERAKREAMDRQNQLSMEALQESTKFQQQRQQLALEAMREQAAARVSSAESGVGGVTAVRSFIANELAEGRAEADIRQSEDFTQFNLQQRSRGILGANKDRVQNAALTFKQNARSGPSLLGTVLGAAGDVAGVVADNSSTFFGKTATTTNRGNIVQSKPPVGDPLNAYRTDYRN